MSSSSERRRRGSSVFFDSYSQLIMIFKTTALLQLTFCISSGNWVFNFSSRLNLVHQNDEEMGMINCKFCRYSNQFQPKTTSFQSLTNRELKVALIVYPPFVVQQAPSLYSGYTFEIVTTISQVIGFKIKYCLYTDTTNLFLEMQAGNIDMLGIPIEMLKNRLYAVHYLPSIIEHSLKVTIRRPSLSNRRIIYDTYLRPFSHSMWISCGLMFMFTKLLIRLNDFIIKKINHSSYFTGYFCKRIMRLAIYSTFVTILSSYSSFLTAALTITKLEETYNGIDDLLKANYKISFLENTAVHHYVQSIKHGIYPKVLKASNGHLCNYSGSCNSGDYDLLHKIYSTKTGFLAYNDLLTSVGLANCSFVSLKESLHKSYSYITLSKDSPYKEIFGKYILLLKSSGILQKLKKDNLPTKDWNCEDPRIDVASVRTENCLTLFLLCAIGIVLSVITCVMEIMVNKWHATAGGQYLSICTLAR